MIDNSTRDIQNPKHRRYADLALLLVALLWGTTFSISKYAFTYFTPLYIMAIRFSLAFILMSIFFWKKISTIRKKDWIAGIVVGIIFYIAFVTQLIALQHTSAGKQAFLAGTYVVMAPFLFWIIYKKRPDTRTLLGAFICFLGIGLLTINTSLGMSFGDGLTLFSSLFFALHIMSNGYFVSKQDPVILATTQFGVVAVLSFITAIVFEPFPHNVALKGIIPVVYLGVFCTGVAYYLQTLAQKYTLSTHAAIILSLESVFGSVFSVVLLGDIFTIKMIIGCLAILIAILVIEVKPGKI